MARRAREEPADEGQEEVEATEPRAHCFPQGIASFAAHDIGGIASQRK